MIRFALLSDVWLAPALGPDDSLDDFKGMGVTVTERVKMAGPFPICIKTEDGKRFNGEYFTIPDPHAGGSMGTVRVRDEKGRVKETWIRPNSSAEGLAHILLREMWHDPEGRWMSVRRPHDDR